MFPVNAHYHDFVSLARCMCHCFVILCSDVYYKIMYASIGRIVYKNLQNYIIIAVMYILIFVPVEVFMNEGNQMKHPCMHTHINITYTHTEQRACRLYRGWASSTECVGHVSVDLKWSSSVVEWMCSLVQRNSTAVLKNKKPITHQSPDPQ